jgi:hypothetical protein
VRVGGQVEVAGQVVELAAEGVGGVAVQADELSLDTLADASENTVPAPVTSAAAELSAAASPGAGSKPSAGNSRTATCPSRVRSPAGRGPAVLDVISSSTGTPLLTGFGWF